MAWVAPSTRSTGELLTAAIWNQDVSENPTVLKQGDIARDKETLDGKNAPPAVSPASDARLYYDSVNNQLKLSRNGGAYEQIGGKLVHIGAAETITEDSTTSGTFATTSLTLVFTPVYSDSTVLVVCGHHGIGRSVSDVTGSIRLASSGQGTLQTIMVAGTPSDDGHTSAGTIFTHAPGAGANTYRTQFRRDAGTGNFTLQTSGDFRSWMLVLELR